MKAGRRNFLAILAGAAAFGGSILFFGVRDTGLQLPDILSRQMAPPVSLTIASAVTKQRWLDAATTAFAEADIRTSSGKPIEITVQNVLSGESMLGIAGRTLQPVVWSPGEMTWVDQLNGRWKRDNQTPVTSKVCEPTVLTPVGLAMWRPMAEALGWPEDPISWAELIALANDPQGWAAHGHPEWGRLRLGHTHPQYSSAGLLFLSSVIYAISGKTDNITPDDIYAPKVEAGLAALAQNTAKYGMVTTDLLNNMADLGPSFLHATSVFEEGAVRFNIERKDDLRWPLAFVFPEEGTFWSDQPYCILDGADWVSDEEAEAAQLFLDFLKSNAMQAEAGKNYVRPLDPTTLLGPFLTLENGTNPAASRDTVPDFQIPGPDVSESIIDQFLNTKRKATVVLVVDTSGSMQEDNRIGTATTATAAFLRRLDPRDRVGLVTFSSQVDRLVQIAPVKDIGEATTQRVSSLLADVGTNLHGAVCEATRMMAEEQAKDRVATDNRLYGIILLSDGEDTVNEVSETRMFQTCLRTGAEGQDGPKMFVISFGGDTDLDLLQRLAQETNGVLFSADPASIDATYLKISAEQ